MLDCMSPAAARLVAHACCQKPYRLLLQCVQCLLGRYDGLKPSFCDRCARDYVVFSPADDWMLMWGDQLWDVRQPRCVHRFDSFTSFATGYFHPAGDDADGSVKSDLHHFSHGLDICEN
jgi:hypothetical protein